MKTMTAKCGTCDTVRALRPFNVRWLDEDRGWLSLDVVALSADAARDRMEELVVGTAFEVREIRATLHAV